MHTITKTPPRPDRVRQVPAQFSWLDHRLVRDRWITRCGPDALALYLLLVTVSDGQGLSYSSDRSVCRLLSMSADRLTAARGQLEHAGLIAYRAPIYQVLPLDRPAAEASAMPGRTGQTVSMGQALARLLSPEGGAR